VSKNRAKFCLLTVKTAGLRALRCRIRFCSFWRRGTSFKFYNFTSYI